MYKLLTFGLFLAVFACGCKQEYSNTADFNAWLNNKDNACYIEKDIAGIAVGMKYLPPAYKTLQAAELNKKLKKYADQDSLMQLSNKTMSFLMTIAPANNRKVEKGGQSPNVMYEGITNYSEFAERVTSMNFFMDQYIKMYVNGDSIKPAMVLVENVYELSDKRLFNIAFVSDSIPKKSNEYIVVYSDPYFGMGDVQFSIKQKDIDKANQLNIKNK